MSERYFNRNALKNLQQKYSKTISSRYDHRRRLSDAHSSLRKSSQLEKREIYRSLNEFDADFGKNESRENDKESKAHENEVKEKLEKVKEESLLGTCRQLRKQRTAISDGNMLCTQARGGRCKRGSSTFPKSMINTPFYIKVSSYNPSFVHETREH